MGYRYLSLARFNNLVIGRQVNETIWQESVENVLYRRITL